MSAVLTTSNRHEDAKSKNIFTMPSYEEVLSLVDKMFTEIEATVGEEDNAAFSLSIGF